MANINKNLKRLLNSALQRCKAHDTFREHLHRVALAALDVPEAELRNAMKEIAKLCDPKDIAVTEELNWSPAINELEKVVAALPGKPERTHGIVHGGEELAKKDDDEANHK